MKCRTKCRFHAAVTPADRRQTRGLVPIHKNSRTESHVLALLSSPRAILWRPIALANAPGTRTSLAGVRPGVDVGQLYELVQCGRVHARSVGDRQDHIHVACERAKA